MISRRVFLARLVTLYFAACGLACRRSESQFGTGETLLNELAAEHPSWRDIGEHYLHQSPTTLSRNNILQRLLGGNISTQQSMTQLREYIRERIARDFREGRTTIIGDWIVSKTEADLFHYCSLPV